jgi:cytochrome P450
METRRYEAVLILEYRLDVERRDQSSGQSDLVRALAWDLPAFVIFRLLGIPDGDVVRVKAGAESRLLLMWGRPTEDAQIRLVQGMSAFWRYAETLVASRVENPRDGSAACGLRSTGCGAAELSEETALPTAGVGAQVAWGMRLLRFRPPQMESRSPG